MKVKARKLLSLALSLAMVMGMLTIPAHAAEVTEVSSITNPGNTFFTFAGAEMKTASNSISATINGQSLTLSNYFPLEGAGPTFTFTAPAAGTLIIYGTAGGTSTKDPKIQVSTDNKSDVNGGSNPTVKGLVEIAVSAAGTYTFKRSNDTDIYYLAYKYTKADPHNITADSSIANGSVKFLVKGEEVTQAESGDEVTVVATANTGYKLAANGITVTDEDNGAVAFADGKFTMPDKAVTVSATFETDSNPDPTGVTISGTGVASKALDMTLGDTVALTATLTPNPCKEGVTWSVEGDAVTVDATGKVTATKKGTATVKVTANNGTDITDSITVTVTAPKSIVHIFDEANAPATIDGDVTYTTGAGTESDVVYTNSINSTYAFTFKGAALKSVASLAKSDGSNYIKFTAPGNGTVALYLGEDSSNNPSNIKVAGGTASTATVSNDVATYTTTAGTTYTFSKGDKNARVSVLVWTPEGFTHTSHTYATDFVVLKEATCTAAGLKAKPCTEPTCPACGGTEEIPATGVHTYGDDGICSVCGDIKLDSFIAAINSAADPSALASANNTEAKAAAAVKTWAEGVVNNENITVAIVDGDFTAAVPGDETDPDGTAGSYKFKVKLTTAKNSTGATSNEKTVAIEAAAAGAAVDKTDLNAAIAAAEAAAEAITVGTDAANVDAGTKWVTQAALDAYKTAIAAAKAVAGDEDATLAQVTDAENALATASTTFEAAQQVGTKADPYTFDATKLSFAGGDEQLKATDFAGLSEGLFGFTGTVLKKLNGDGNAVTSVDIKRADGSAFIVTIPEGKMGELTTKLCSTGSTKSSKFAMKKAGGADIPEDNSKNTASGGTSTAETFTWSELAAGTYHIYCPSGDSNLRLVTAHVDLEDAQGGDTPTPGQVVVTGVTLHTHDEIHLTVGETTDPLEVDVDVTPDTAENRAVTWTSSDTAVATVSADGVVTAVAAGTATITVKSVKDTTKSDSCTVKVEAAGSEPTVTTGDASLVIGDFEIKDKTISTQKEPLTAAEMAAAENAKGYFGVVGTVNKRWGKNDAAAAVTAFDILKGDANGVTITLNAGQTATMTAKLNSASTSTGKDVTPKLTKDGTEVAYEGAAITALPLANADAQTVVWNLTSAGTYTLVGVTASNGADLRVKEITLAITTTSGGTVPVTSVALDKTTLSLTVGGTSKLTATVNPANATNKDVNWKSGNTAVATVAADGTVTAVAAGTAKITATTKNGKTASCTVTVTASGSSGSSSGGGSGDMIPSTSGGGSTVTNPDGSKTNTKTNSSTGAVTETTTYPNGDKTVVVTEKDGTVTETATKKDGTRTETVTKPDGSTTVAATDAKGIKTEVATSAAGEVSAKVSLPKNIDKTVVTIPVKDVTDGTVAVIVNANGAEQVIKTSMAGENGLELLVDKNVSVKIKDNAKKFDDIEDGYWAKGAVDFVSSREIFKGVYETVFAPADVVNRGMMATVLYRLADAKAEGENVFFDVADGNWYTDAVVWANHSGVVTGYADGTFGPADAVTREQMAAMLFRFAKATGMNVTVKGDVSKFSDANDVSSWASEAMAWAVGVGLINGVGDPALGTILAPAKTASRAEVATLMQRMVKLMMQ